MKKQVKILCASISLVLLGHTVQGQVVATPDIPTLSIPVLDAVPSVPVVPAVPAIPGLDLSQASSQGIGAMLAQPDIKVPENPASGVVVSQDKVSIIPNSNKDNLKKEDQKDIYLNFDNTDLANFINYIAEIKKLNLIADKTIEGAKISLSIREPLSVEGAWNVFLTVLETAGFSIVHVGDIHKIIPKDKKTTQPLPVYINVPFDTLPDSDINIRYVMFLNNLDVGSVMDLLKSMLSNKDGALEIKEVKGIIITDKSFNVKAAAKLLTELDQMGTVEAITVLPLKNVNATDVRDLLGELIKKPEQSPLARLLGRAQEGSAEYFPPGTKIIAEERTNSLVLLGHPKPLKKIEEFIVNNIDTELKEAKSPLYVYELQYTDASQIKDILTEVTGPGSSAVGQAAAKYGAIRGGVKFFRGMTFQVDKDGNRLIVSCTDKVDWKLLKKTIRDLDKPQPQIALETLIVTVDVTDGKELGGSIHNKKHGQIGKNIDFQSAAIAGGPALEKDSKDTTKALSLLGDLANNIVSSQGLSVLTFGKQGNVWAFLKAIKTQGNTSVLSQPFITVANKKKATIVVGREERVVTEEQGGEGGLKGFAPAKADTNITVEPQINLDGVVRLDIDTKIEDFVNGDPNQKTTRALKTNVTVANGQILVLGGFIKTKVSENTVKTPFLGDIPLLGWFFKNQKRSLDKQYIFIFMCPTIIKPRELAGMGLYTKMKMHNATDDIENSVQTKRIPDPIHNWFFNAEKENYSHKVIDFANARYQPMTVDIKNDPYYRSKTKRQEVIEAQKEHAFVVGDAGVPPTVLPEEKPLGVTPLVPGPDSTGQAQTTITTTPPGVMSTDSTIPVSPPPVITSIPTEHAPLVQAPVTTLPVLPVVAPAPETPPLTVSAPSVPVAQTPVPPVPAVIPVIPETIAATSPQVVIPASVSTPVAASDMDKALDERRQKLKELLGAPASGSVLSQASEKAPVGQEQIITDLDRRNNLKNFLSANPTLSFRTDSGRTDSRRGVA